MLSACCSSVSLSSSAETMKIKAEVDENDNEREEKARLIEGIKRMMALKKKQAADIVRKK